MQFLDDVRPVEVGCLQMQRREPWERSSTPLCLGPQESSRTPHGPSFLLGSRTAFTQGPASYSENMAKPPVGSDGLWEPEQLAPGQPDRFPVCPAAKALSVTFWPFVQSPGVPPTLPTLPGGHTQHASPEGPGRSFLLPIIDSRREPSSCS